MWLLERHKAPTGFSACSLMIERQPQLLLSLGHLVLPMRARVLPVPEDGSICLPTQKQAQRLPAGPRGATGREAKGGGKARQLQGFTTEAGSGFWWNKNTAGLCTDLGFEPRPSLPLWSPGSLGFVLSVAPTAIRPWTSHSHEEESG